MALQTINIGTAPNDGTGDTLHDAFRKENENWQFVQDIIDNDPASLQAIVATEQANIATAQAVIATAAASTATGAAASASVDASTAESARDAAIIGAGVYVSEAAGLAAVSTGDAFKVQGTGDVAAYEYRKTASANLFDTTGVRDGKYVSNSTGNISSAAGWGVTPFIPVTAGLQYTVSGTKTQSGCGFFSSASDSAAVAGSYSASATPFTVTAPVGATHMVLTLYSPTYPTYTNIQVEQAAAATEYHAYGTTYGDLIATYPSKSYVDSVASIPLASLVLGAESYINTTIDGDDLKIIVAPFLTKSHTEPAVFGFSGERWNDVWVRTAGDDTAPYWVYDTIVGARHGYAKTTCTVAGHGKTYADVGSVWADGFAKEWVIVDIPSVDTIALTARTDNAALTTGTLTHVSGATHTTSFSPTLFTQGQLYPSIKNRTSSIMVDGAVITDYNREYPYSSNVTFTEQYEVLEKNSLVEWLITQVGTATDITDYDGTSGFSVSMAYVFDPYGTCVIYTDFVALDTITGFEFLAFTQAATMTAGVDGAVKYYVPKSLPFTQGGDNYDFSTPYDMTSFAPVSAVDFTPARCEATGIFVDRIIQMNDSLGMAVGFLPLRDAHPDVRRTLAVDRALNIFHVSKKIYMMAVDDSTVTTLSAGDYFGVVAYRSFYKRNANRTGSYVVRSHDGAYLYCDWHTDTIDRVTLPVDLHGKPYTLVEKSANVTILSAYTTNSIAFDVAAAGSYGYAILKF